MAEAFPEDISVSVHLFSVRCSLVMAFHRRATEETSARVTVLKQVVCQAFDPVFCIADLKAYLEASWAVISGVISKGTIAIIQFRGLITSLITTHEPPSK